MVASGKSTIYEDQRAMPESSAGTKARDETFTYDEATYEEADEMDGTSSRSRAVPNEAHSKQHIRAPGVGQNAQKMWAQMQNSPRLLETIDATRHGRPQYSGTLWSRNLWENSSPGSRHGASSGFRSVVVTSRIPARGLDSKRSRPD